jgi:DNA-binding NtrC family response regulator
MQNFITLNAIATTCMTGKTEKRQFATASSILKNAKYIKSSKEDAYRGKRDMAKVFVVDDEESIRFSFNRMLTDAGHEVIVAGHSVDAKAILAVNEFDVAVIDRILTGGETGLELIKCIKKMQPSCETILISAYPTRKSAAEALQYETFAYLNKPVKKEELCRVVKEAVRIRSEK